MKTTVIFFCLFIIFATGCNLPPQYGGIYTYGDNLEQTAKGITHIYPENDSTFLFHIYTSIGSPSYNSRAVNGRIMIRDGEATFRKRYNFAETDCVLHFRFRGDTLTIVQVGNDCECGFGNGIYLDNIFLRKTSEIPEYYTTISNKKVWFSQWKEEEEVAEEEKFRYHHIDSSFTNFFPDLKLGQEHKRGKLFPAKIANKYLPDRINYGEGTKNWTYAVGKIIGYKGMDLFICDEESERVYEDSYDNHMDGIRSLLLYHKDGYPVLTTDSERKKEQRQAYQMNYHYYGEGGETNCQSYFDKDTTLFTSLHISESESATGFGTPLNYDEEYRWTIMSSGEIEILEVTRLEFSSPFYDRNYLKEQNWSELLDEGFNRYYPTKDFNWVLSTEICPLKLTFHIENMDGELFPIFETIDDNGKMIDRYIVGKPYELNSTDSSFSIPIVLKCPVIIKTSDGILELHPERRHLELKKE